MKDKPNAKCPECGKEFFNLEADPDGDKLDELYCSKKCLMKGEKISMKEFRESYE